MTVCYKLQVDWSLLESLALRCCTNHKTKERPVAYYNSVDVCSEATNIEFS
jgi:hypothetical protein